MQPRRERRLEGNIVIERETKGIRGGGKEGSTGIRAQERSESGGKRED